MKIRNRLIVFSLISLFGLSVLSMMSCGGNEEIADGPIDIIGPQPDTIPPSAVNNLRLSSPTHQTLAVVWTAPGDDGDIGTASRYQIRFSKQPITEENWSEATALDSNDVPAPQSCDKIETIVATGLESSTRYYFALKTSDEADNESPLSNIATERTTQEEFPPGDVTDLVATGIDESSFELTWTAPGDDYATGTASQYDIRYSIMPILDVEDWNRASPVSAPPSPKPAGEKESFVVTGLPSPNYFFVLKTTDSEGNRSGLSNLAAGLGINEQIWAVPSSVPRGEFTFITFRASPSVFTRISVHELFWWWEPITCGEKVVADLYQETVPGGVYTIKYDFFDEATNRYLPSDTYILSLCWGPVMKEWIYLFAQAE